MFVERKSHTIASLFGQLQDIQEKIGSGNPLGSGLPLKPKSEGETDAVHQSVVGREEGVPKLRVTISHENKFRVDGSDAVKAWFVQELPEERDDCFRPEVIDRDTKHAHRLDQKY